MIKSHFELGKPYVVNNTKKTKSYTIRVICSIRYVVISQRLVMHFYLH